MKRRARELVVHLILLVLPAGLLAAKPASETDRLGRTNPRSAVTAFLESCQRKDYREAAQYLDLHLVPKDQQPAKGVRLSQQLESILDSDSSFSPLHLSESAEGDLGDDADPSVEHVTTVRITGRELTLDLRRSNSANGLPIWLFSAESLAAIPRLLPATPQSAIESKLPGFLVTVEFLNTPLWKWIALFILALVTGLAFRVTARTLNNASRGFAQRLHQTEAWTWLRSVLEPLLVFLFVALFAIAERQIEPSALSRLYIGRGLLLIVVSSVAWGVINLTDMFLRRLNFLLDERQRVVSHSLIYLGRRVVRAMVVVSAAIIILSNWGYDMSTIIAGLGVGGIAVALAAQQTIANIFGGVSVIGDNPVMVGDFGNFGGLVGTIEDIGMRSTRVRTLNRTLVSVPNGSFAGMNLENYSVRDKILFNPTLQIKRSSPKDQIRRCMSALREMLASQKIVEVGPAPVRLNTYTAASFGVEIFAYVLTGDINEFYKVESELLLAMDDVVAQSGVELV